MGLFDNIKYENKCPKCGEIITNWQTKEGNGGFELLEPYEVKSFYSWCKKCGSWIDAIVDVEVEHIVSVKKCDIKLTINKKRSRRVKNK